MKALKTFIYEQLIGKRGTTTNLEKAIELEKNGASEIEILQQTHWQRGHDNNWKFEIPNGNLKISEIDDIKTLNDIWDSEELYEYYPQIKNCKVTLSNSIGEHLPNHIILSLSDYQNKSHHPMLRSILIHEIQHEIQSIEGWNSGAPSIDTVKVQQIIDDANKELEFAKSIKTKIESIDKSELKEFVKSKYKEEKGYWRNVWEYISQDLNIDDMIEDVEKEIKRLEKQRDEQTDYYDSFGEQEAYAVQHKSMNDQSGRLVRYYKTTSKGTKYTKDTK